MNIFGFGLPDVDIVWSLQLQLVSLIDAIGEIEFRLVLFRAAMRKFEFPPNFGMRN